MKSQILFWVILFSTICNAQEVPTSFQVDSSHRTFDYKFVADIIIEKYFNFPCEDNQMYTIMFNSRIFNDISMNSLTILNHNGWKLNPSPDNSRILENFPLIVVEITVELDKTIMVRVGIQRSPLDGGGQLYSVELKDGIYYFTLYGVWAS